MLPATSIVNSGNTFAAHGPPTSSPHPQSSTKSVLLNSRRPDRYRRNHLLNSSFLSYWLSAKFVIQNNILYLWIISIIRYGDFTDVGRTSAYRTILFCFVETLRKSSEYVLFVLSFKLMPNLIAKLAVTQLRTSTSATSAILSTVIMIFSRMNYGPLHSKISSLLFLHTHFSSSTFFLNGSAFSYFSPSRLQFP